MFYDMQLSSVCVFLWLYNLPNYTDGIDIMDGSPRSSRAGGDVGSRRSLGGGAAATWQGSSASVLKRYEPDGCNSHYDVQTGGC